MQRIIGAAVLIGLLVAASTSAVSQHAAARSPANAFISIGTGAPTGVYFAVGNAICRLVEEQSHKEVAPGFKPHTPIDCAAPATPGSLYNLGELRSGAFTFGLVQSDWQFHALRGTSKFEGQPFQKLRAVLSLYSEVLQIIQAKDTTITDIKGLTGKRVSIGAAGSGTRATFEAFMPEAALGKEALSQAVDLAQGDQNKELCAGNIDIATYMIGIPNSSVQEAITKCGGRLMSLPEQSLRQFISHNPFYAAATIPAGTYQGANDVTNTFGVVATLVASETAPDAVVYEVVRDIFERMDDLRAMHPALARLDPARMMIDGISVPLHAGTLAYHRDSGTAPGGNN